MEQWYALYAYYVLIVIHKLVVAQLYFTSIRLMHFALLHHYNYVDVSEGIELLTYLPGTFCRVFV